MDVLTVNGLLVWVFIVWISILFHFSDTSSTPPGCPTIEDGKKQRVALSLLKASPSSNKVIYEGTFCSCSDKNETAMKTWNEGDLTTFTWYHHERIDWLVQYKFCYPLTPLVENHRKDYCQLHEESEDIAIMTTPKAKWEPVIEHIKCLCASNRTYMKGWDLDRESKGEDQWRYIFTCDRRACKSTDPCSKQYTDSSSSHTAGYRFLCSCPEGYICPVNPQEKLKAFDVDGDDEKGLYILGNCQKLPGYDKDTYLSREPGV